VSREGDENNAPEPPAEHFRGLFEAMPGHCLVLEPAGMRVVAVTEAYLEVMGRRREEILGQTVFDALAGDLKEPADGRDGLRESLERVVARGETDSLAVRRHTASRPRARGGGLEERYWRPVTRPVLDGEGRVVYLIHQLEDVTRRVEAEARARDADALERIAGHAARLGGWRVTLDPPEVVWSPETRRIHETPEDTGLTLERGLAYYVPEHREHIRQAFDACARRGMPMDEVAQIVTGRGHRRWVRVLGEAERDAAGAIHAVRGAFQDITELVAAREQGDLLARRLQETLDNISDAFFTLDRDWCFTFVNSALLRLPGRGRQELMGRGIWECFPEARGTTFDAHYRRAWETGEPVAFTARYEPLGCWLQVKAYPSPEGLAVYLQDVTRERSEQEQLQLLRTAVSRLNDIVIITEAEPQREPHGPKILYVNEAFERHTGYTRAEAIGRTPRFLQGPDTDRAELDRIGEAMRRWRPVRAELVNYTKAGEPFWLELDLVPLADETGWYTHWVAVERDVTERKRAQEQARINEERFRLLARATNDVIWDWDLRSGRVWWSENLEVLFGHPREGVEPGPESWTRRIHPEDRGRVVEGIHAAIAGSGQNWEDEYRFLRADGSAATVIDRGFIIRDPGGSAIRMLGSMVDVTEQRSLEQRIRQSQKLEAVGQLTGGVAHDFNNLLTVILGNAEVLSESLTHEQHLRLLAEMTGTAAERGAELTGRLLAFARQQALEPKVVDLNRLLVSLDGLLRRTLPEHIDMELVQGGGLWLTEIDPGQLEVALLNLAVNARDAMPEGGRLTIETGNAKLDDDYAEQHEEVRAGQYVRVSVSDTGTGMDAAIAEQAFQPFFTTKEIGQGSGLGLSMVYGFVKQSGGHAKIYTEPGHGTTVTVYFPRVAASAPEIAADADGQAIGGHEHILVVEDDNLVREHLMTQLRALGYRVTGSASGPEALAELRRLDGIDLLLTDVVMPGGMNGRELADEACRLCQGLKVLFTSGYTENAIVHHGRLDPGVALLSKPYRRQELAAKVRRVLEG